MIMPIEQADDQICCAACCRICKQGCELSICIFEVLLGLIDANLQTRILKIIIFANLRSARIEIIDMGA